MQLHEPGWRSGPREERGSWNAFASGSLAIPIPDSNVVREARVCEFGGLSMIPCNTDCGKSSRFGSFAVGVSALHQFVVNSRAGRNYIFRWKIWLANLCWVQGRRVANFSFNSVQFCDTYHIGAGSCVVLVPSLSY